MSKRRISKCLTVEERYPSLCLNQVNNYVMPQHNASLDKCFASQITLKHTSLGGGEKEEYEYAEDTLAGEPIFQMSKYLFSRMESFLYSNGFMQYQVEQG